MTTTFRRSFVDDVSERLRHARHPGLRRSVMLGSYVGEEPFPVLIPDEFWESGFWITGAARSGKTHRALLPLAAQRIRRHDCPVVFVDHKGDDVLFHAIRQEALAAGRPFRYFSNVSYFSTHLFNPLTQDSFRRLSISEQSERLVSAFNLWHGFSYGRFYFSSQSRGAIAEALKAGSSGGGWTRRRRPEPVRNFVGLEEAVRSVIRDHPEYGGAQALLMVVQSLAQIPQINVAPGDSSELQPALESAIDVSALLRRNEQGHFPVYYFYLRAQTQLIGAAQISKLLLHSLQDSLRQLRDDSKQGRTATEPPVIALFLDEWQVIADEAFRNLLEQGGSLGLQMVLANQDISQLADREGDMLATVWENCGNKLFFSARDLQLQERLMAGSGEKSVVVPGLMAAQSWLSDKLTYDASRIQLQLQRSTRLERNHILEMSDRPGRAVYVPPQGVSVGQYGGYPILVDCPYLFRREKYEELDRWPWPPVTDETIVPADAAIDSAQ